MDGTSTVVTAEPERPRTAVARGRARLIESAPAWWFHVLLLPPTLLLFWADSSPAGGSSLLTFGSLGVLFLGASVWASWLIMWLFNWFGARRRKQPRPPGRRFLIAPSVRIRVSSRGRVRLPPRWPRSRTTRPGQQLPHDLRAPGWQLVHVGLPLVRPLRPTT